MQSIEKGSYAVQKFKFLLLNITKVSGYRHINATHGVKINKSDIYTSGD
jgi:hypothetical protein